MTAKIPSSLHRFVDWLRLTDPHASFHLPLLAEADRALDGPPEGVAPSQERRILADKLERWRYQHLNERRKDLSSEDRQLVDALDLAANQLAGRPARRPRDARWTIHDSSRGPASMAEAMACLDPGVSLDEVSRRASELTLLHFLA